MPIPVKLSDVVEQLGFVSDDSDVYLNRKTGEFVVLTSDQMFEFEDDDLEDDSMDEDFSDESDLMEERKLRREVFESDDYIQLPDKFEMHDWQIMQDFCLSVRKGDLREELLELIRGRGAFGRFNSAIHRLRLENSWHDFKNKTYEQVALDWLEANAIPFVRDSEPTTGDPTQRGKHPSPGEHSQVSVPTGGRTIEHRLMNRRQGTQDKQDRPYKQPQNHNPPQVGPTKEDQRTSESEIKVFISHRDSKCEECGEQLGRQAWITLEENKGAVCLACADLDELLFLPSGDAALTRRSKKYSTLSAVVLKFSKARGRYERQGLLVEENALAQAEAECLADSAVRERRNERARERQAELDEEYIREFAKHIRGLFPNCPEGREQTIAEHACLKFSGRVGRSAAAKSFDEEMVRLAVAAHVRHRETNYDLLLARGWPRSDARAHLRDRVDEVLKIWSAAA